MARRPRRPSRRGPRPRSCGGRHGGVVRGRRPARRPRQPPAAPRHRSRGAGRAATRCSATTCSAGRATGAYGSTAAGSTSRCAPPTSSGTSRCPSPRRWRSTPPPRRCVEPVPGANFPEIVTAGLGPTVADHFYLPYARKLFGVDPGRPRRRTGPPPGLGHSSTAILRRWRRPGTTAAARSFHYPRRGFGQLPEALADAAGRRRGRRSGCPPTCGRWRCGPTASR